MTSTSQLPGFAILSKAPWKRGFGIGKTRAGGGSNGPEVIDADVWFSDWERGGTLLDISPNGTRR